MQIPSLLWKHYKNKNYRYRGIARHSETLEELVLYEALYPNELGKTWVRPKEMFHGKVVIAGNDQDRFHNISFNYTEKENIPPQEREIIFEHVQKFLGEYSWEKFNSILDHNKRNYAVTAEYEGKMIGFKLGYARNQECFHSWLGGVDVEFRGLGIASQLIKIQHDWCKKNQFKMVETQTLNQWREMLILNLRNGFQIMGTYMNEKNIPQIILRKYFE